MKTKILIYNKQGFDEQAANVQFIKPTETKEFETVKKAKQYIRKTYPNNKLQPSRNIGKYIEYNEKVIGKLVFETEPQKTAKIEVKKQPITTAVIDVKKKPETTTAIAVINKTPKPTTIKAKK